MTPKKSGVVDLEAVAVPLVVTDGRFDVGNRVFIEVDAEHNISMSRISGMFGCVRDAQPYVFDAAGAVKPGDGSSFSGRYRRSDADAV